MAPVTVTLFPLTYLLASAYVVYSFDILMHAQSLTYVTRSRYRSFRRFAAAYVVYSFDILMHAQSLTYVTRSRYKSFHRFAAAAALIQLACFNTYDYIEDLDRVMYYISQSGLVGKSRSSTGTPYTAVEAKGSTARRPVTRRRRNACTRPRREEGVRCAAVYEALIAGRDIVPVRTGCSFY
jgi:hypothetical protein